MSGKFGYKDSVDNRLEAYSTMDGLDLGINDEYAHIETKDVIGIAQAILRMAKVDYTIVEGKLPEVVYVDSDVEWKRGFKVKDSFPERMIYAQHADTAELREFVLDTLAFADAIENYRNSEERAATVLMERRNKLAREITEAAYGAEASITDYQNASNPVQVAIDRIIELEQAA